MRGPLFITLYRCPDHGLIQPEIIAPDWAWDAKCPVPCYDEEVCGQRLTEPIRVPTPEHYQEVKEAGEKLHDWLESATVDLERWRSLTTELEDLV